MNQEDEKIYQKVKETFAASTESDEILAGYTKKLTGNAAKYSDAWGYASRVGGNVSDALLEAAPEIFNAEDGYDVVMSALRDGYEMTSKYAAGVQTLANREAGIGLKGVEPDFMTGRASGIAHAASNAEDLETTEAYLGQPVQLFTENVVGDTIKANEEFQYKSGLNPKIRRTAAADCCEWCNDVAGDYSYPADDLIYRRHANCNCLVEYYPGNGLKQNTHTKKWDRIENPESFENLLKEKYDTSVIPMDLQFFSKMDGKMRRERFGNNWDEKSMQDAVNRFASGSAGVREANNKIRFSNGGRYDVLYDTSGDYFRIEDTKAKNLETGKKKKRRYTDFNGNDVSMKIHDGKIVPRDENEYERMTHFRRKEE